LILRINVQRQVFRVDDPVQEPQPLGDQVPAVVLHEHTLGAQAHPVLLAAETDQLQVRGRTVNDRAELDRRIGRDVQVEERLLVRMVRQVLIKLRVLFLGHLALGLDPDRLLAIDDLAVDLDRVGDEARIGADHPFDLPVLSEELDVLLEM
jgi:hypothetical protein